MPSPSSGWRHANPTLVGGSDDEAAREVKAPRVNDKRVDPETGERQRFSSAILPAWARKSPQMVEVLPLLYLHGANNIIPGLENALYDMEVGGEKTVVIDPEDAYGVYDEESTEIVKKDEFSEEIPLDVGTFLDLEDDEGEILSAQIIEEDDETVTLDFNHPLAGKVLTFKVTVSGLREATPEELEHGHAH